MGKDVHAVVKRGSWGLKEALHAEDGRAEG